MSDVDQWLKSSPFSRDLGLSLGPENAVVLTVTEPHTRHGALHGGATAALAAASAQVAVRGVDPELDPATTSLHVTYPRAGRGSVFTATTSTLRRAAELGFCQTEIVDERGRVIAGASSTLSGSRQGGATVEPLPSPTGDPARYERGLASIPYLERRGLRFLGVEPGLLETVMEPAERNLDESGRFHEGALLTLIDFAGASVPWTLPDAQASGATISLHAQFFGATPDGPVVARAVLRAGDGRMFWSDVSVFTADERQLCATGSVAYRFR